MRELSPRGEPEAVLAFDRRFVLRWIALALLYCWPMVAIGHPSYYYDTTGYYKNGHDAVSILGKHLIGARAMAPPPAGPSSKIPAVPSPDASVSGGLEPDSGRQVKAARSLLYGVMTYLLAGPAGLMLPLAVVQSLAASFVSVLLLARLGVDGSAAFAGSALVLGLTSTAPWFATLALPDIFAAVGIASLALLLASPRALSAGLRVALVGIAALSFTLHASHLASGLAMLLVAAAGFARRRVGSAQDMRPVLLAGVALVGGMLAVGAAGYVAFGEVSLAPKRPPLTLARMIEDGPGRQYLREACPARQYEICKVMPDPPTYSADIVFGPRGLTKIATSAQLDRIRSEEPEIVLRTIATYPGEVLRAQSSSIVRQLASFGLIDLLVDQRLRSDGSGMLRLVPGDPSALAIRDGMQALTNSFAWLAIAMLPVAFWLMRNERNLIVLLVAGVVANAIVCGSLSVVADRYQGRVIWLLPVILCALVAAVVRSRAVAPPRPSTS